MYPEHTDLVRRFYEDAYLRNRYPSLSYISQNIFIYPQCPDLASVALGHKPSCLIDAEDLKDVFNDYFLTHSCYRGKHLVYLSEELCAVCDAEDIESFKSLMNHDGTFKEGHDAEWGRLLGYPNHLVRLFVKYISGQNPDWDMYDLMAERKAMKMFCKG